MRKTTGAYLAAVSLSTPAFQLSCFKEFLIGTMNSEKNNLLRV